MSSETPDAGTTPLEQALQHDDGSDPADVAAFDHHGYLCTRIGTRRYAIATDSIAEVTEARHVTPIPHTPEYIPGVFTRRGRAIPLFDLARFVGEPQATPKRYVIVSADKLVAGIPVASIEGIRSFETARLEPVLPDMQRIGPFIAGHFLLDEAAILVLDVARLLASARPSDPRAHGEDRVG